MAVLHNKEEKIRAVVGRLPKKYTDEDFVSMFIKLYSKDWGKIKSAYIKQSQDKAPGTVINMPKPDLYLKQLLTTYLQQNPAKEEVKPAIAVEKAAKPKAPAKEKALAAPAEKAPKAKAPVKKATKIIEEAPIVEEKSKTPVKKKVTAAKAVVTAEKKTKAVKKSKEI